MRLADGGCMQTFFTGGTELSRLVLKLSTAHCSTVSIELHLAHTTWEIDEQQ